MPTTRRRARARQGQRARHDRQIVAHLWRPHGTNDTVTSARPAVASPDKLKPQAEHHLRCDALAVTGKVQTVAHDWAQCRRLTGAANRRRYSGRRLRRARQAEGGCVEQHRLDCPRPGLPVPPLLSRPQFGRRRPNLTGLHCEGRPVVRSSVWQTRRRTRRTRRASSPPAQRAPTAPGEHQGPSLMLVPGPDLASLGRSSRAQTPNPMRGSCARLPSAAQNEAVPVGRRRVS